ncbi:MAG: M28 family peptidase [Candidatus Latescibacterota bacterium]|nr:M28 family peptidase [Candidatus Latescibacterota bacterium]
MCSVFSPLSIVVSTCALLLLMIAAQAEVLAGVAFRDAAELPHIQDRGLELRHVASGVALFSATDESAFDFIDADVLFRDRAPTGETYYLSDHQQAYLPEHIRQVYRDLSGWSLMRLSDDHLLKTIELEHFLYPVPRRYRLDARAPRPSLRPALPSQPSPDLAELLGEVSAERLQAHVEALSLIDPTKGSVPGNLRTRYARRPETFVSTGYIADALSSSLGESMVHLDTFRINAVDSLMFNVVGELRGTDPDAGYYVICAHYDAIGTRSRREQLVLLGEDLTGGWDWRVHPSPGANDNASGIALVLEAARVLSARTFPWSVKFIAWSGEELGLWGSRHYANLAGQRGDRILGVLNFDMIGFNDLTDRIELVANPNSVWLVDLLRETNERYDIGLQIDVLEDRFAGLSDHAPFWANGYDAILGIENYKPDDPNTTGVINGDYRLNTQYHTVVDLPDSINWELVARATRLGVGALAQFGIEAGPSNLAVFTGDLRGVGNDLEVQIANIGLTPVEDSFVLRVSRCELDSTSCTAIYEERQTTRLVPGDIAVVRVPWSRFGDTVFLVEVDPENAIAEASENDNLAFQAVHLIAGDGDLAVFPNPFLPARDPAVHFNGVPKFARITITDPQGSLIWQGREEEQGKRSREVLWSGVNDSGFSVASGIYVYTVRSFEGQLLHRGKIAVMR